ncbi:MAG: hypothetical protein R6V56_02975 [Lentisphaeria bacterium]
MARRTLSSTWRNFEKLIKQFDKTGREDTEKLVELEQLAEKINNSKIANALTTLFVHPYDLEEATVSFHISDNGSNPQWQTRFNEEGMHIEVCVLGVFEFIRKCREASKALDTPEARRTFQHYRYQAYLAELGKLPGQYFLFLMLLRQVASIKHITDVEKKGGEIEVAEGEEYLKLLWAFKELETFFKRTKGLDIRSEYQILWLESDWFVGK